jgi:hypothetical protein
MPRVMLDTKKAPGHHHHHHQLHQEKVAHHQFPPQGLISLLPSPPSASSIRTLDLFSSVIPPPPHSPHLASSPKAVLRIS